MLPGFRFLFAAVVLSLSILVFGLGAAALLRAAHEQFASLPSRRAPAEPVFARQNDVPLPTLALLRFDPPALEKTPDNVPTAAAPETVTPAAQAPDPVTVEPDKLAALPEEPMSTDAAPAAPATETAAPTPAAAVESVQPLAVQEEVKVAAIAEAPQPSAAAAPATDTLSPAADDIAATKIATLGGPIVVIDEKAAANAADAKQDRSAVKKRAAQRARERRRIAARRARLAARQAALAAQQLQANPFGQTTTTRTAQ